MNMIIYTPHGDIYTINLDNGNVNNSESWKFLGFTSVRSMSSYPLISLSEIKNNPSILKEIDYKYKNNNPRLTWIDNDYGHVRIHGNTQYHGIAGAYIEKE